MTELRGPESAVSVHLNHIVDRQAEAHELADLPIGWGAARDSVGDRWRRFPL